MKLFEIVTIKENNDQDVNKLISVTDRNSPIKYRILNRVIINKDEITPASQLRLFMLFRPKPNEPLVEPDFIRSNNQMAPNIPNLIEGSISVTCRLLFRLYRNEVFTNKMIKSQIEKLAKETVNQSIPLIKRYYLNVFSLSPYEEEHPLNELIYAAKISGNAESFKKIVNDLVREKIKELQNSNTSINSTRINFISNKII